MTAEEQGSQVDTSGNEGLERAVVWLAERGVAAPDLDPPVLDARVLDARVQAQDDEEEDLNADSESVARTIVLRKLSVRAHTRAELERALRAKGAPDQATQAVLDRMTELGLLNDEVFARDWVESRQQRRHLSRRSLQQELARKGIERETLQEVLKQVDGNAELTAARALVEKKRASLERLEPKVRYRRLAGVLARRGYSSAVVAAVLAETLRPDSPPADQESR